MLFSCPECDFRIPFWIIFNSYFLIITYIDYKKTCYTEESPCKYNQCGSGSQYTIHFVELARYKSFHTRKKVFQCSQPNNNNFEHALSMLYHRSTVYDSKSFVFSLVIIIVLFNFNMFMESKSKVTLLFECTECDCVEQCWICTNIYLYDSSDIYKFVVIMLSKTTPILPASCVK